MKKKKKTKTKMHLLDSAGEFLVEAFVSKYTARNPRFAIVHAVTAAELVLKERLARIHPNLIFENIDAATLANKRTVSLRRLPVRLLNLGVKIEQKEVDLVYQCADWRNQIVHHLPGRDFKKEAEVQFPKLLNFIAKFMRRELHTGIEKILPLRWYHTAKRNVEDWKHAIAEAQKRAAKEGGVLSDVCPECGGDNVLSLRKENKVHCHLCGSDDYKYHKCPRCGRQTVTKSDWWCDKCLAEITEAVTTVTEIAPPAAYAFNKGIPMWARKPDS
jgi:rRNA maturation protein Nop10